MRDYKYPTLIMDYPTEKVTLETCRELGMVKSDCLKPCAEAFANNLMRTIAFAMLPMEMAFQSNRNLVFQVNAIYRVTGQVNLSMSELAGVEMTPQIEEQLNAQRKEFESFDQAKISNLKVSAGLNVVQHFIKKSPQMRDSMEAVLTSILLESCLFFEAFVSDLWVAAVDNATKGIANKVAIFNGWNRPDENIKVDQIVELESNAHTHPGSFYREVGKVSFTKLRDTKTFYAAAFGKEIEKLFDGVEGGYINALVAVRNCIAHSAGRVDPAFKRAAQRFPEFSSLNIKDPILLDGQIVKKLRHVAAETGLALLRHVDEILVKGD